MHSATTTSFHFPRTLGGHIRRRRLELRLSQADLAIAVEVTQSSISNYEMGRSEPPLSVLLAICREMQLPAADLVTQLEREHAALVST